ncbi:MAG: Tad domain-containing protein [Elusimicrobiota bacterium]|jgi:hypothetical protein|nr:Tad domain-containing protein [Elusimicrobiota bacterium]
MNKRFKVLTCNKGQSLYYIMIFVMIIVLSWAMMLNIARLISDRMKMQNIADNAALSIATHRARTLNYVANLNYLIGVTLSLGTNPGSGYWMTPSYNIDHIGATIGFQGSSTGQNNGNVASLKFAVDAMTVLQTLMFYMHLLYENNLAYKLGQEGYTLLAEPYPNIAVFAQPQNLWDLIKNDPMQAISLIQNLIKLSPADVTAEFGLKRNKNKVKYKKTKVNKWFLGLNRQAKYYDKGSSYKDGDSWLVSTDDITNQKVTVVLQQNKDNTYKPLFSRLLNISMPVMRARSAAIVYNTKGTMFPKTEDKFTGADTIVGVINYAVYVGHIISFMSDWGRMISQDSSVPFIGPALAIEEATALTAFSAVSVIQSINSYNDMAEHNDNPIWSYRTAKQGGWFAQLTQYDDN